MSMLRFAELMRKKIIEKRAANRSEMEKGKPHEEYMRLCGRNQELREMLDWINEITKQVDSEEGEDEL